MKKHNVQKTTFNGKILSKVSHNNLNSVATPPVNRNLILPLSKCPLNFKSRRGLKICNKIKIAFETFDIKVPEVCESF